MKMAEAKQKLMDLAAGKYHSMEYSIDDHGNGNVSQKCKVYIDGYGHSTAAHWDTAIQQITDTVSGKPLISEDLPVSSKEATAK
ncbi:MAG: hypothetical protein WBB23_06835 [Desulforhopalus sp.]